QFKPVQPPKGAGVEGFAEFWKTYPKKVGKDAAEKAWNRKVKTPETIRAILEAVKTQAQSDAWKKEGGQFVPNPATWLNAGRWKDEDQQGAQVPSMFAGVI
ncbi:MAG: helix-turn-helix domain-containing protein, partial [Ignavibacteria bacterium]